LIGGACLIVLMASGLFGQSAQPPRAFEVASVKPHDGPLHTMRGFSSSGARLTLEGDLPVYLIMEAYNLKIYQVSFAVPEPERIYYDIFARQMLQTLLADRFKLKVHRETKEMPVYALLVGKNGPKFKESASDAVSAGRGGPNGRNQYIARTKATMEDLAQDIGNSFLVGRPVLDKTGLTGTYGYRIEATPQAWIDNNPELSDIGVFAAVQEQLGLKLEPQKAAVEILVVDHIEKPTQN
jgi:uncharacterized protein (TIGR03435 family)